MGTPKPWACSCIARAWEGQQGAQQESTAGRWRELSKDSGCSRPQQGLGIWNVSPVSSGIWGASLILHEKPTRALP